MRNNIGFKRKFCKAKYLSPPTISINSNSVFIGTLTGKGNLDVNINSYSHFYISTFSPLNWNVNSTSNFIATLKAKASIECDINVSSNMTIDVNSIVDYNVNISLNIDSISKMKITLLSNEKNIKGCFYEVIYVDKKYIIKYCC